MQIGAVIKTLANTHEGFDRFRICLFRLGVLRIFVERICGRGMCVARVQRLYTLLSNHSVD